MKKFIRDNKAVYYQTHGNPDHPCLILINGIGGQLIYWPMELLQLLVENKIYVITLDNRDCGWSHSYDELYTPSITEIVSAKDGNNLPSPPYHLEDMAEDVVLLMQALGVKKAHIAGTSMGGMITQILAINYPQYVASMICIASTSQDQHLPPPHPQVTKFFSTRRPENQDLETFINDQVENYRLYNHPNYFDEIKARNFCIQSYQRAYNPHGFIRQLYALISAKPRGAKLKELQVPSLIIHGTYDPVFPIEHGNYLAQILPNSHLIIIQDMGHDIKNHFIIQIAQEIISHVKNVENNNSG